MLALWVLLVTLAVWISGLIVGLPEARSFGDGLIVAGVVTAASLAVLTGLAGVCYFTGLVARLLAAIERNL